MKLELPPEDDKLVWDAWLSLYQLPSISVALELDIFESLLKQPASPTILASRMNYSERALIALLAMLKSLGFLIRKGEYYHLTDVAQSYFIKSSPYFWGGLFKRVSATIVPHKLLLEAVTNSQQESDIIRPADGWESGHVEMELARAVTAFMHSHSMVAAVGMTKNCDFSGIAKLLDVGGGSACFSIALALENPEMTCTVMELPAIC
jgi:3-hydroxy-5-methyl-1-naphthoate 3-O-methyltransferase